MAAQAGDEYGGVSLGVSGSRSLLCQWFLGQGGFGSWEEGEEAGDVA